MGLLGKLFSKKESESPVMVECPHTAIVPRWENAEDMGKSDRISSYLCTACNQTFSPEQAAAFRVQMPI